MTDYPKVTKEDLENNIDDITIQVNLTKGGQVLRWAIITTKSGFAVTGDPSAAVSPENDNPEMGTEIAITNAKNKLWQFMGYELKQRIHNAVTPSNFIDRIKLEREELFNRICKLASFLSTEQFENLEEPDKKLLIDQHKTMNDYMNVLDARLSRFV